MRHRLYSFEGTACADIGPEQWYYQLTNPVDGHKNWMQTQPSQLPVTASPSGLRRTTLSGGAAGSGTGLGISDTTMNLAAPAGFANGDFLRIDSEIVLITAGGNGTRGGATGGSNPFTILRGQYGTVPAAHTYNAAAYGLEGQFHNAAMVHDLYHDAFFLFGSAQAGANELWVYCDTSQNALPGSLTVLQSSVGCTKADDWTNLTPNSICADATCWAAVTGINGANSGKLPPGFYYPSMDYDSVSHQLVTWAGGKGYGTGN